MKKNKTENEETKYSLLSYHDSWWILTTDGKNPSVIITPWNIEHFYSIGEKDYLVGEAKKLYEKLISRRNR